MDTPITVVMTTAETGTVVMDVTVEDTTTDEGLAEPLLTDTGITEITGGHQTRKVIMIINMIKVLDSLFLLHEFL